MSDCAKIKAQSDFFESSDENERINRTWYRFGDGYPLL